MGFSTLAIAMAAPQARVVAIDTGLDAQSREGLALTRKIAAAEALDVVALQGASPEDVASTAQEGAQGHPIGCVFIDGYHSNEQVVKDFEAAKAIAASDAVFVFHDVRDGGLRPGLAEIRARHPSFEHHLLEATSSGIAVGTFGAPAAPVAAVLAAFTVPAVARPVLDDAVSLWRRRRSATLHRSLVKRFNALRKLAGLKGLPLPPKLLEG
jgi:hypothetical protein